MKQFALKQFAWEIKSSARILSASRGITTEKLKRSWKNSWAKMEKE